MNDRINILAEQAGFYVSESRLEILAPDSTTDNITETLREFAELIIKECASLNKHQSYELIGVITDVEEGDGFDDVCLNTVKRVADHLSNDLKEHFGVEK
jgi:hypothetical protein